MLKKLSEHKTNKWTVDSEINRLMVQIKDTDPTSAEYETLCKRLELLSKSRDGASSRTRLSKDQVFAGAISILELILIMNYERLHVFGGKALNFITRPRLK